MTFKYSGILLGICSSTFVSFATTIVLFLQEFHPFTLAIWRFVPIYLTGLFLVFYYYFFGSFSKGKVSLFKQFWPPYYNNNNYDEFNDEEGGQRKRIKTLALILIRSFLSSSAIILQFSSMKYLTYADSASISYSAPIFVSFLGYIFLGEPLTYFSIFVGLFSMTGVVIITRPPLLTGEEINKDIIIGSILAFICTIFRGTGYVIIRYLKDVHHSILILAFGAVGSIMSFSLAFSFGVLKVSTNESNIIFTVLMGIFSCAGQICVVLALKKENAGQISLVRTMDIIFAFLWQMIFFKIYPDLYSIIGSSIILCGILLIGFRKYVKSLDEENRLKKSMYFVLN